MTTFIITEIDASIIQNKSHLLRRASEFGRQKTPYFGEKYDFQTKLSFFWVNIDF